jgi:hypothetical protein
MGIQCSWFLALPTYWSWQHVINVQGLV